MTRDRIYQTWAPPGAPWSPWVKPVVFAHLPEAGLPWAEVPEAFDLAEIPDADGTTAVVVDAPGATSVAAGLALARIGYRPVVLFNSVPLPGPPPAVPDEPIIGVEGVMVDPVLRPARAAVDMWPIMFALAGSAGVLSNLGLPWNAPPAFLLDSRRRQGSFAALPGQFDNRSLSLPTDFPSASILASMGIRRVIVVDGPWPQADLLHTLLRWHEGGVEILLTSVETPRPGPVCCPLPRPRGFRLLCYKFFATLGLRRNVLGGYGGFLPEPGEGGG